MDRIWLNIKEKIKKIKKLILTKLELIFDLLLEKDVKNLFLDIKNYNKNKINIILFFLFLPFSTIFIFLNIISFLIHFFGYLFLFLINFIKIKLIKNKNKKTIKYVKRLKFLKNFYILILKKVFITFPKKKAFLVLYILLKKVIIKEELGLEKEVIIKWLKAISNRYIISFIIGLPFITLYCNNELIKIIDTLKKYNYENKLAFINTIILNIYKSLIPDYTKLVEKLKIIITKKNIKFNSLKEIIKALKHKKSFNEDFQILKNNCIFASAKQKISNNKFSKKHPTVFLKTINNENIEKNKTIYLNETSASELKIYRFQESIQNYIDERMKNSQVHFGSINKSKKTYYTPPIETNEENIFIGNPINDKFILNDIEEENINNIAASLSTNFGAEILTTKKIKIGDEIENRIIKEETEKAFIEWVKNNKNKFDNKTFESLLRINYFWEENEIIIKEMSLENKIELAKIIGLDLKDFENTKDVNFKIFVSFLNKKI